MPSRINGEPPTYILFFQCCPVFHLQLKRVILLAKLSLIQTFNSSTANNIVVFPQTSFLLFFFSKKKHKQENKFSRNVSFFFFRVSIFYKIFEWGLACPKRENTRKENNSWISFFCLCFYYYDFFIFVQITIIIIIGFLREVREILMKI